MKLWRERRPVVIAGGIILVVLVFAIASALTRDSGERPDPQTSHTTPGVIHIPTPSSTTTHTAAPSSSAPAPTSAPTSTAPHKTASPPTNALSKLPAGFPLPDGTTVTSVDKASDGTRTFSFTVTNAKKAVKFYDTQLRDHHYYVAARQVNQKTRAEGRWIIMGNGLPNGSELQVHSDGSMSLDVAKKQEPVTEEPSQPTPILTPTRSAPGFPQGD